MSDAYDEYHQRIVKHLVHHPIIADPDAPKAAEASFQGTARKGVFAQPVDRLYDA